MPHHERISIDGRVGDIFRHRFVVELDSGKRILADIGPKGADAFPLETGLHIVAEGEMKPSELKVERIGKKGGALIETGHKPHGPGHHHDDTDPDAARRAVVKAGFEAIGTPRRKPKHFEVLGRKDDRLIECHVEFDGHIRKEKPVDGDDPKWADALKRAA